MNEYNPYEGISEQELHDIHNSVPVEELAMKHNKSVQDIRTGLLACHHTNIEPSVFIDWIINKVEPPYELYDTFSLLRSKLI